MKQVPKQHIRLHPKDHQAKRAAMVARRKLRDTARIKSMSSIKAINERKRSRLRNKQFKAANA